MKKRISSLALALLLAMSLTPSAAASSIYSDVPDTHWAAENIDRATQLGLFQGVGNNEFGLGRPISRAEFVTVLGRLFDWEPASPQRASYTDVSPSGWYYAAVETARANDAVDNAYPTFRPDEGITRGEMASMLVRSLGYTYLAGAAADYDCPFPDAVANRGYITVAYDLGLMGGEESGRFNPDDTATREQAATVLVRLYDQLAASSSRLTTTRGYLPLTVASPDPQPDTELPITPLEPLTELYAGLRQMKAGGTDMDRVVLRLTAGGIRTITSGETIVGSDPLSAREVEELLARKDVTTSYSDQYESAYCFYHPNEYQTATVWYQSEKSQAAKLQLARLFGVTKYVLE